MEHKCEEIKTQRYEMHNAARYIKYSEGVKIKKYWNNKEQRITLDRHMIVSLLASIGNHKLIKRKIKIG